MLRIPTFDLLFIYFDCFGLWGGSRGAGDFIILENDVYSFPEGSSGTQLTDQQPSLSRRPHALATQSTAFAPFPLVMPLHPSSIRVIRAIQRQKPMIGHRANK
eukprot:1770375-Amphidinium_carterae.1